MSFKNTINHWRRMLMNSLTRKLGSADFNQNLRGIQNSESMNILVSRPNSRLGNQLLLTPLIQDICDVFPNCSIDLFVRGSLSPIIFENYKNINRIIQLPKKPFSHLGNYIGVWLSLRKKKYDISFNAVESSSSGRLSTCFTNTKIRYFNNHLYEIEELYTDYKHIAKFPVYNFRSFVHNLGFEIENKPIPRLDIKLSSSEMSRGKELLRSMVHTEKSTICIYTYATGDKCYSREWWMELYLKLKDKYQHSYNIIEVLPIENISQIDFAALSFYSKDIREIAALIANSTLFIGADSGIMHLACSSGVTTIGLFSVSNIESYTPYGGKNMGIDTNSKKVEEIIACIDMVIAP